MERRPVSSDGWPGTRGRRTYDIFASYWPYMTDPGADLINNATKFVATNRPISRDWKKTVRLAGDLGPSHSQAQSGSGPELQVHGSGALIH